MKGRVDGCMVMVWSSGTSIVDGVVVLDGWKRGEYCPGGERKEK